MRSSRTLMWAAVLVGAPTLAWGQNVDMGETFHELEIQATLVTTRFEDVVAVTQRDPSGVLSTGLFTEHGELLGAMALDTQWRRLTMGLVGHAVQEVEMASAPFERAAADWFNAQLYILWQDARGLQREDNEPATLVWYGKFLRDGETVREPAVGTPEQFEEHVADMIQSVESQFQNWLAISERLPAPPVDGGSRDDGERPYYAEFSTRLLDASTAAQLGILHWFPEPKTLAWDFPDVAVGKILDSNIPGGMPFTPNPAWSNVQAIAFLTLRPLPGGAREGDGAEWLGMPGYQGPRSASCSSIGGGLESLGHSDGGGLIGTPQYNHPGCDGLHWLDGTIYRPCCDNHDNCYAKWGCTWKSWWTFEEGWRCVGCNIQVLWCFMCTGPMCDEPCCIRDVDGFCDPECSWCC